LNDKIEKKIHLMKKKTLKRMKIKIDIQNKFYTWSRGEIEKKNKHSKKTQKNKKNKDQIGKNNIPLIWIEWWNWKQIKLLQDNKLKN
jgi:hypothetical protein